MIFGQNSKRFFLGLATCALLIPAITTVWNARIGAFLFLVGIFVAGGCLNLIRHIQVEGTLQDQEALDLRQDRGRMIYVSLVDDRGIPLDALSAQARINVAEAQAGPRDTVIGVHRPLA